MTLIHVIETVNAFLLYTALYTIKTINCFIMTRNNVSMLH